MTTHQGLLAALLLLAVAAGCDGSAGSTGTPEGEHAAEADAGGESGEVAPEAEPDPGERADADAPGEHDADANGEAEAPERDPAGPDCSIQRLEDVTVPLSDGKALAGFVRRPVDSACRLPTILLQTPYDKENARALWFEEPADEPLFNSPHYAFAVVDWRGFHGSRDAAVPGAQPPYEQDGFDTVEWIAAQPWSDGKVGTWGVSALCGQQYRTAAARPPHLAAAVPIFCQPGMTYEQYYPGGVLRREYATFIFAYYGAGIVEDHPLRDGLWQLVEQASLAMPGRAAVPMLVVAGWYDLYNTGTLQAFDALRRSSDPAVRDAHRLLIGEWIHFAAGAETEGAGRGLSEQELKYFDSERRIQRDSLSFFDLHLRGLSSEAASWPAVRYARGGGGGWSEAVAWPPAASERTLHLWADGSLRDAAPSAGEAGAALFRYDPEDPSPTAGGQTLLPTEDHGPQDQAAVLAHPEARAFVSAPLDAPLTILGAIRIRLAVRTAGTDTDFAVRLTDVDAGGTHWLLTDGIQRLKLRDDLGAAAVVNAGEVYEIEVRLTNELAHRFAAGRRIGLIVSSSNHPRFARNPNNGDDFMDGPNPPAAVNNAIELDGRSRLILMVE